MSYRLLQQEDHLKAQLRENKKHIRTFMQAHYTDEKLAQLLDHARAGHLTYNSCCCFVGIATAVHALRGRVDWLTTFTMHLDVARYLPGAAQAEAAFYQLPAHGLEGMLTLFNHMATLYSNEADILRRRILIPMVKAEIRRRHSVDPTPVEAAQEVPALAAA